MSAELTQERTNLRPYADYSIERKAEVLALIEANNGNIDQTARETGIPHQTIRFWFANKQRFSNVQTRKLKDLDIKLDRNVHKLLDSIEDHDLETSSLSQKASAFGIVFDKLQLVRNLPTSINATLDSDSLVSLLESSLSECIDITPESQE
jgi:transposase-like protein